MRSVLRTIVVGALVLVLVTIGTFELAIHIYPTLDTEGHRAGQAFTAIVVGVLFSALAMVVDRRMLRRR